MDVNTFHLYLERVTFICADIITLGNLEMELRPVKINLRSSNALSISELRALVVATITL